MLFSPPKILKKDVKFLKTNIAGLYSTYYLEFYQLLDRVRENFFLSFNYYNADFRNDTAINIVFDSNCKMINSHLLRSFFEICFSTFKFMNFFKWNFFAWTN